MAQVAYSQALEQHVQGLREAKAAFLALPEIVRTRMNEANEVTAREIVRNAKAKVLASPSIRTRSLYNAIRYTLNKKSGRARAGIADVTTTVSNPRMGFVGKQSIKIKGVIVSGRGGKPMLVRPVRYVHLVEFGAKQMNAEPFMVPAMEAEKRPHIERCRRAGKAIETDMAAVGKRYL